MGLREGLHASVAKIVRGSGLGRVGHRHAGVATGGGGYFQGDAGANLSPTVVSARVLFVREMATEVEVDGVEYMAMHQSAVVGLSPE